MCCFALSLPELGSNQENDGARGAAVVESEQRQDDRFVIGTSISVLLPLIH